MTRLLSPLSRAADAIEEIHDDLRGLPLTPEVRKLHGKWLTEAQQSRLVADVGTFVRDVAEAHGRFAR